MPKRPNTPCKHPGCPRLTNDRYCDQHAKLHISDRAGAVERGYVIELSDTDIQALTASSNLCGDAIP